MRLNLIRIALSFTRWNVKEGGLCCNFFANNLFIFVSLMAAPPFSSSSSFFTYDVFLSFRGPDTRHSFTGFLYKALSDRGIRTFIDDEELQRGHQITPSLLSAIKGSRIAIPVLSANYASSSFCLDELSNILDCIQGTGRLVLPVFYAVDPCDVRHQRGAFGEALSRHEEKFKDKVQKWREALHQAANLSGFHFNLGDGYEYEFIKRIVDEVSNKINRVPLHVADYLVGMESRVLKVNSLLDVGSGDGVHMVGIYGIGGMGKTTLAQAVYNSLADYFDGLCFLEDVRENSSKHGLLHLQETLLSEMVGEKDIKISSVSKGISIIKHRLQQKKVLLILDDVNKLEQLQAIAGGSDWFGSGSRVLITTRDKHLLSSYGVERKYEIEDLNGKEALKLLSWNAFKDDKIDPSYLDILNRAVAYASGLPLALHVIGSNLFGKSIEKWKSALNQYEKIPNKEIQKILRVSFDGLDEEEQSVFLDIACCFKGFSLPEVEVVLRAHHSQCMKYHIEVLIEKSLIKIKKNRLVHRVTLHDLVGDMGKEIVRQESPKEPGKRSRLWMAKDIVHVLEDNTGTSNIEIIYCSRKFEVVKWDGQAFNKMTNLKTLIITKGHFLEGPKQLPESLKVLEWWEYPSHSLPPNFYPKKLAIFRLPKSCIMSIESAKLLKTFVSLRVLDFRWSKCITEIPDVSGVPNLEEISFPHCENLIEIHESIGFLNKLRVLNAFGCGKLRTFPPLKLGSLRELELSDCHSLESFPEILGKMKNITILCLKGTPIKILPSSIRNLSQLRRIQLFGCGSDQIELPSSIVMLPNLKQLGVYGYEVLVASKQDKSEEKVSSDVEHIKIMNCKISDEFLPICLTWFANVKELNLSSCDNNFTILPACIKECHFMRKLGLNGCGLLEEIRGIPPILEILYAEDCTSLKYLDLTLLPACTKECHFLRKLKLDNCEKLQEIRGIPPNLEFLSALNCKSLTPCCRSMLLSEELHAAGKKFYFPETRIPDWFEHRSRGRSIYFWFRNKIPAICLCVATRKINKHFLPILFRPKLIINHKKEFLLDNIYSLSEDHMLIFGEEQITFEDNVGEILENKWNHAVLSIDVNKTNPMDLVALEIGLHVFKQKSNLEDIRFTYPLISDDLKTFGSINHLFLKRKRTD